MQKNLLNPGVEAANEKSNSYGEILNRIERTPVGDGFSLELKTEPYPFQGLLEAKFGSAIQWECTSKADGTWSFKIMKLKNVNPNDKPMSKPEGCCGICGGD